MRTEEVIAAVVRSVEEDPNQSIRHRAQELDVSIHFMEDFAERSWFAGLQNPTRARIEVTQSPNKACCIQL